MPAARASRRRRLERRSRGARRLWCSPSITSTARARASSSRTSMIAGNAWAYSDDFCTYDGKPPRATLRRRLLGRECARPRLPGGGGVGLPGGHDGSRVALLVRAIGKPALAVDERFATRAARSVHDGELVDVLGTCSGPVRPPSGSGRSLRPASAASMSPSRAARRSPASTTVLRDAGLTVEFEHPLFGATRAVRAYRSCSRRRHGGSRPAAGAASTTGRCCRRSGTPTPRSRISPSAASCSRPTRCRRDCGIRAGSPLRRRDGHPQGGPAPPHRARPVRRRRHTRPARCTPRSCAATSPRRDHASRHAAAARALPGVVAVFTSEDFDGTFGEAWHAMLGEELAGAAAAGRSRDVRHVGEPIALVVAESRYVAEDACDLIEVDFDREPTPCVDFTTAAADTDSSSTRAWGLPSNAMVDVPFTPMSPDLDQVFASTPPRRRGARSGRTATSVCRWRRRGIVATGRPAATSSTSRSRARACTRPATSSPATCGSRRATSRVQARDVGGGFGQKMFVFREECAVVLASRLLGATGEVDRGPAREPDRGAPLPQRARATSAWRSTTTRSSRPSRSTTSPTSAPTRRARP